MAKLRQKYNNEIAPKLMEDLKVTNKFALPKLEKIVINVGLGEALKNASAMERVIEDIVSISGQRPIVSKAKKSISNFSLREGDKIGCYVTMRGERAWDFLDRFVNLSLPRVKDFRGVSKKSFDSSGNYSLGFKDLSMFPEVDTTKIDKIRGFEVTFVIKNSNKDKSIKMLEYLGMPFDKHVVT
jgi:large subunit ribosomal protein L5